MLQDTFLDAAHVKESFPGHEVEVQNGTELPEPQRPFRVTFGQPLGQAQTDPKVLCCCPSCLHSSPLQVKVAFFAGLSCLIQVSSCLTWCFLMPQSCLPFDFNAIFTQVLHSMFSRLPSLADYMYRRHVPCIWSTIFRHLFCP